MLRGIDTKEKINVEQFEEKVVRIYNEYKDLDIDAKYIDLWNMFVEMIEFIQENSNGGQEMSPQEVLGLMKDLGFSQEDLKELIKSGIKND